MLKLALRMKYFINFTPYDNDKNIQMNHTLFYRMLGKVPPKRIRHVIYVEALRIYKADLSVYNGSRGLCYALHRATHTSSIDLINLLGIYTGMKVYGKDIRYLPEIARYRPNEPNYCQYWFPLTDTSRRLLILKWAVRTTRGHDRDVRRRRNRMMVCRILEKAALVVGSAIISNSHAKGV